MALPKILIVALLLLTIQSNAQQTNTQIFFNEDNCLLGQDLNAADVDVSRCPVLPTEPTPAALGTTGKIINLGAWELGQTAEGETYKYGVLSAANGTEPRVLNFQGGSSVVNDRNIEHLNVSY